MPDAQKEEAQALRNKLLSYRFRYRDSVAINSALADNDRSARTNQLLIPLLSITDDKTAREAIRAVVQDIDEETKIDRSLSTEAAVLEVLCQLMARSHGRAVSLSDITRSLIERFGRDFDRPVSARYVGEVIRKRLRLKTYRTRSGYMIVTADMEKIRYLAERYGIASGPEAVNM